MSTEKVEIATVLAVGHRQSRCRHRPIAGEWWLIQGDFRKVLGRHLVQQSNYHLGCPHSISECLGLSLGSAIDSSFLLMYTLGGSR